MVWIIRFWLPVVLFTAMTLVTGEVRAQKDGPPETVVKLVNEMKLGVQAYGGVQHLDQTVLPLQNRNLEYLRKSVSGELPYTMPYYGVGIGLRLKKARIAFTYRIGNGVQPKQWIRFEDGADAIPYRLDYDHWSIRAEYFVFDWIGAGIAFRNQKVRFDQVVGVRINGKTVSSTLFSGRAEQNVFSAYLPLQKTVGKVRLFGRAATSVAGNARDFYSADFVRYQSPDFPDRPTPGAPNKQTRFKTTDEPVALQHVRLGGATPVWGLIVRVSTGVKRLNVPERATTWSYDVQLEVGLPF